MTNFLRDLLRFYPILLALFIVSCGSNGPNVNPTQAGQDLTHTPQTAWILGRWEGLYLRKSQESGSFLREAEAQLNFEGTGEGTGTFSIDMPQISNASVKGTYKDFAHKSLMLNIKESTVSSLGLTGNTADLSYELTGNDLLLANERIQFKLSRKSNDNSDNNKDPTNKNETTLIGRWYCYDRAAQQWNINIKTETNFSLDIFDTRGIKSSLWLDGKMELDPVASRKAMLTVESSETKQYLGLKFSVELTSNSSLSLLRSDGANGNETLTCARK